MIHLLRLEFSLVGVFCLFTAVSGAFAEIESSSSGNLPKETKESCGELLSHGGLLATLAKMGSREGTKMVILPNNQADLDHTQLGPEGKEILARLDQLMIGHQDVKIALASAVQRAASRTKNWRRPIATILLLGITGTGKSLTAEALAEAINDDPDAKITMDCGEVQHDHEISKITGSPAGYVGHNKTPPLVTQQILNSITSKKYKVNVV